MSASPSVSKRGEQREREEKPLPPDRPGAPADPRCCDPEQTLGEGAPACPVSPRTQSVLRGHLLQSGRLPPAPGALSARLGVGPSVLPLPAHSPLPRDSLRDQDPGRVSDGFFLHRRVFPCGAVFLLAGCPVWPC